MEFKDELVAVIKTERRYTCDLYTHHYVEKKKKINNNNKQRFSVDKMKLTMWQLIKRNTLCNKIQE